MDGTEAKQEEAVRRLFEEVFAKGNLDIADEVLMPDFSFSYPFPGFPLGVNGLKAFVQELRTAFPDIDVKIENLFAKQGEALVRWTMRGTHNGEFLGIAPTENQVTVEAIGWYSLCPPHCLIGGGDTSIAGEQQQPDENNPRISRGHLVMDNLKLMQQIGAVPPDQQLFPRLRQ
jgi:steroid delta-isomerase-like uncharacterized protein